MSALPDRPRAALPVPLRRAAPRVRSFEDTEFLAPALAILETPPSPIRLAMITTTAALAASALAWASLSTIEITASAQGKLQPVGRVKTVQPLETGRVSAILVGNGSRVTAGTPLVRLDGTEAAAERTEAGRALASLQAEVERRRAAMGAVAAGAAAAIPAWRDDIPEPLRSREERVLAADLAALVATVGSFEAQRMHKRVEHDQLIATIAAQASLVATLQERLDMRNALVATNAGTRAAVLDAREALQGQQMLLIQQQGQLAALEAEAEIFAKEATKARDAFVSDNAQKLADAERQIETVTRKLAQADARLDHMVLTAPAEGTVEALSITNTGQVLTAGQEVMRIVPGNGALEAEVNVANRDIGFVAVGQTATIKLEAFPFTRYGTVAARVVQVAGDALPAPDAGQVEADATHTLRSLSPGGTQRMRDLVYPVRLSVAATSIDADGRPVALTPGMTVTATFNTGRRRVLDYLLSPLTEISSDGLHER